MKSRTIEFIGVFALMAISLAIFTISIIAWARQEPADVQDAVPTGEVELTQSAATVESLATSLATINPFDLQQSGTPREPTFTAESTSPATILSTGTALVTSTMTPKSIQKQLLTKTRTPRRRQATPCPRWMFWCR